MSDADFKARVLGVLRSDYQMLARLAADRIESLDAAQGQPLGDNESLRRADFAAGWRAAHDPTGEAEVDEACAAYLKGKG